MYEDYRKQNIIWDTDKMSIAKDEELMIEESNKKNENSF